MKTRYGIPVEEFQNKTFMDFGIFNAFGPCEWLGDVTVSLHRPVSFFPADAVKSFNKDQQKWIMAFIASKHMNLATNQQNFFHVDMKDFHLHINIIHLST